MPAAALPVHEADRLETLKGYSVLDTPAEQRFDRLTRVAGTLFRVPIALITLIDQDRQFIKSCYGPPIPQLPREVAFCAHGILSDTPLVVCDALLDPRFADNPLVTGEPGIRFYAGAPLTTSGGFRLGSLCVIDLVPKPPPSEEDLAALKDLADEVVAQLEFRRAQKNLLDARTDLNETRNFLYKSHQRAMLAMESGRMGYWEWNAETNLISFSPLLLDLLGFKSPNEYDGSMPGWLSRIHPDDRETVVKEVGKARETQEISTFKYRVEMADDSERWITTTGRHKFDKNGDFIGAEGVSWDSTAEELTARHLRTSEDLYRGLLATSPVGVVRSDMDGNVMYCNRHFCSIYEMTEEEILGSGPLQMVHPDDRGMLFRQVMGAAPGDAPLDYEFRLVMPDGRIRWIHGRTVILRDGDGKAVGVVGTQEDVTERKLAMEELKAAKAAAETANRAKDAFLANMSHELRTPLNGVLGMTDLLMESGLTRDQLEMAEVVRTAGLSLLRVVSDLLDFSRLEAGQISPRSVPFHLQEMVDQVVAVVRPEAKRKGLQLFVSPIPKLPYALRGDPGRIKQVLMQYLGNAVKFTDAGTISLQVQVLEKARQVGVVLSVRDKGPGIEPQLMNKLFQPFSQVDDSSTRRHGGVGMGLAICKSLADMMGGSVGAESTPGSGSTFWLRLSLATCAENPPLSLPF